MTRYYYPNTTPLEDLQTNVNEQIRTLHEQNTERGESQRVRSLLEFLARTFAAIFAYLAEQDRRIAELENKNE